MPSNFRIEPFVEHISPITECKVNLICLVRQNMIRLGPILAIIITAKPLPTIPHDCVWATLHPFHSPWFKGPRSQTRLQLFIGDTTILQVHSCLLNEFCKVRLVSHGCSMVRYARIIVPSSALLRNQSSSRHGLRDGVVRNTIQDASQIHRHTRTFGTPLLNGLSRLVLSDNVQERNRIGIGIRTGRRLRSSLGNEDHPVGRDALNVDRAEVGCL